jgi:hypothetical protein
MTRNLTTLVFLAALALAACTGQPTAAPVDPTPTSPLPSAAVLITEAVPTEAPPPAPTDTPGAPVPAFEAATYRDEEAGFELDYPAAWDAPVPVQAGERGSVVQFSAANQPLLDVAVLRWDPKYDLAAYSANRELAWDASGIAIVSQETFTLADGREAARYIVESQTGELAFFFFTTVGDRYLQLSGSGDLDTLIEVAATVRPVSP